MLCMSPHSAIQSKGKSYFNFLEIGSTLFLCWVHCFLSPEYNFFIFFFFLSYYMFSIFNSEILQKPKN